jgi:epoxyqueuosine reductase QueG
MLAAELKATLMAEGATLVGYADVRPLPPPLRDNLPVGVSIAIALDPTIVSGIRRGPTPRYHVEYLRAERRLDALTERALALLKDGGHEAVALPVPENDVDTMLGSRPLPHRTAAALAGLGWVGKCDLLVTREYGSAVRLRTILTDAPLPPATPIVESQCGECTLCVFACPGGAPRNALWKFLRPRPEILNIAACRKTTRAVADGAGMPDPVCGVCIPICPYTQAYLARASE